MPLGSQGDSVTAQRVIVFPSLFYAGPTLVGRNRNALVQK
jgi:hypothetical protein